MSSNESFDVYLNTADFASVRVAKLQLSTSDTQDINGTLRYQKPFLKNPHAFALNPDVLPLSDKPIPLSETSLNAVFDSCLPDGWAVQALSHLARYRKGAAPRPGHFTDRLAYTGQPHLGAITLVPSGKTPDYAVGSHLSSLDDISDAIKHLQQANDDNPPSIVSLAQLTQCSTGLQDNRPGALFYDDDGYYLAQFSQPDDDYNHARVTLALLLMAEHAGIEVSQPRVSTTGSGDDVLLVNRSDVTPAGERQHRLSLCSVAAELGEHCDATIYDDVAEWIANEVEELEHALMQWLRRLMFNGACGMGPTSARDVALDYVGGSYRLSPLTHLGINPMMGYAGDTDLPKPGDIEKLGRVFGLSKPVVTDIANEVSAALGQWQACTKQAGLSKSDMTWLKQRLA